MVYNETNNTLIKKHHLKLTRRSLKIRRLVDKSHLRDLRTRKTTATFNKNENYLESRKADDDDVQADSLFYEEMGFEPDEAESSEGEAVEDFELQHKGSFRNVDDEGKNANDANAARLPIKIEDKVVEQGQDDVIHEDDAMSETLSNPDDVIVEDEEMPLIDPGEEGEQKPKSE